MEHHSLTIYRGHCATDEEVGHFWTPDKLSAAKYSGRASVIAIGIPWKREEPTITSAFFDGKLADAETLRVDIGMEKPKMLAKLCRDNKCDGIIGDDFHTPPWYNMDVKGIYVYRPKRLEIISSVPTETEYDMDEDGVPIVDIPGDMFDIAICVKAREDSQLGLVFHWSDRSSEDVEALIQICEQRSDMQLFPTDDPDTVLATFATRFKCIIFVPLAIHSDSKKLFAFMQELQDEVDSKSDRNR